MKFTNISFCYYPTTLLLVDDKKDFLMRLYLHLVEENKLICQFYIDPRKALTSLKNYLPDPFLSHCYKNDEDSTELLMMDFNIKAIRNEIYNTHRFQEITLVVVDYAMPSINGSEFCQQIGNKQIKKLMLTGEGDKELAVQLFNEEIIDKFVLKHAPNLLVVLNNNIQRLQQKYFLDLSEKMLTSNAGSFFRHLVYLFNNTAYLELFNQCYQDQKAVEFYLLDNQGSMLFLDETAKPSWLVVVSEEEMHSYSIIAEDGDEIPKSTMTALKKRTHVPYFHSEEDWLTPPHAWAAGNYLHPAQRLADKEVYYYTYIDDPNAYNIEPQKILSYRDYREKYYQYFLEDNHF